MKRTTVEGIMNCPRAAFRFSVRRGELPDVPRRRGQGAEMSTVAYLFSELSFQSAQ